MSWLLVLTIVVPLLGVVVTLGTSLIARVRPFARYVAIVACGINAILVLALRWVDPARATLSLWSPASLFGAGLTLQSDTTMQPLAFVLMLAAFLAALVGLSCEEDLSPRLASMLLALQAAVLASLWSANPLTMMLSWTVYDLLQAAGCVAAGGSTRSAIRSLVFGSVATLFLWAGAVLSYSGASSALWSLVIPNDSQLALWAMAGILRLWVYPFHLAVPRDLGLISPSILVLLLGPLIGWGLWLRLASVDGGTIAIGAWLPIVAITAMAMGGVLAWTCKASRSTLAWLGTVGTSAVLLAAVLAGEDARDLIWAGSVAWTLAVTVLFIGSGAHQEAVWWRIPALVGALALLGAPLTLGFAVTSGLVGEMIRQRHFVWWFAFFAANLFLVPSLWRWLARPVELHSPDHLWKRVVRGIGLGLPALLLVGCGLYPPLLFGGRIQSLGAMFVAPGLAGWLLWVTAFVGGGLLAWQGEFLRARMELFLAAVHDLLRLDWLYGAVLRALDRGLNALQVADGVIGGAGALLWSWLLFLILALAWSGD